MLGRRSAPDPDVPLAARIEQALLKKFGLKNLPEGSLHIAPVGNAEGLKLYLVKTIDPRFGRLWGIRAEDGGAHRRATGRYKSQYRAIVLATTEGAVQGIIAAGKSRLMASLGLNWNAH